MSGTAVWPSVIAVIGTLSGGALTGFIQQRISRAARRDGTAETRREAQLTAVTSLAAALADHRRAMWVREEARLSGAGREVVEAARGDSHVTRSAVTAPLTTVAILAPSLAQLAHEAAAATYALRNAPDLETLAQLREQALKASDQLIAAASALFA